MKKNDWDVTALIVPTLTESDSPEHRRIQTMMLVLDACFQLLGIAWGLHTEPCVPKHLDLFTVTDKSIGSTNSAPFFPLIDKLTILSSL